MNQIVVCIDCGHVQEVAKESELERDCLERAKKGFLDALPIPPEQCDCCTSDRQIRDARTKRMLEMWPEM